MRDVVVLGLLCVFALDTTRAIARDVELKPGQPLTAAAIGDAKHVVLRGGVYVMNEPLVLTPANSGLTIEAYSGERPVVSGGRRIEGWRKEKFNGRDVFAADVPGVREGTWFFRQLWINDERATRARRPNGGAVFHVKESPDATANWEVGQSRFRYDSGDVPGGSFAHGAEAIIGTRWVESRLPIKAVDVDQKIASFLRKSQWRTEVNDPYFLEGDGRWLDEPGEFFLDRKSGELFYLPRKGEEIDKMAAIAPSPGVTKLLELRGEPAKGKFVEDVIIRGITFAHNEWMHPAPDPATQPVSGGFVQAALPLVAAVSGQGLRRVNIQDCTFRNLGTWALELGQSTQHSNVRRCAFRDLGGGGIKLGSDSAASEKDAQTFDNTIEGCTIARGGRMFMSAVGIWIGQAFDNRIAHNEIRDFFYSGISAGWTWGYGDESLNRGNVFEKNHIHHIGTPSTGEAPMLADMGAIYLLGGRRGTVVRNNVLHDIAGVRIAWGVYLDEGCCDVLVENNLVYRAAQGAFHLHYGRENIVRNNIFALGGDPQIYRSREEDHRGFTIERNIIYWTSGSVLTRSTPRNVTFDRNIYGGIAEKDFRVSEMTWAQWRAAGQDQHSIIADPGFIDLFEDDFRLKADSPAKGLGFERFELSDVGPRK